jgi:hypothetical protein
MNSYETKLAAGLEANSALRTQAERPDSDRPAIISDLVPLFDGPQLRKAQRLAADALDDNREKGS